MQLVRFRTATSPVPSVGIMTGDNVFRLPAVDTLAELWRLRLAQLEELLTDTVGDGQPAVDVELLAPIDELTEVWAAGVTYLKSRQARVEESANSADVYDRVYSAARPELFFKSAAWRVVGHRQPVAIRSDSEINVPEPELALVINAFGEIVGYTICNDVSSRSIEGENPLYLPQAKVYLGSCAIGSGIRPVWEVDDPYQLAITLAIARGGQLIWNGSASTAQLHRRLDELTGYLTHAEHFPDGVILSTGTSLVPDLPFTLQADDTVTIDIDQIGTLSNDVVAGKDAMAWLRPHSPASLSAAGGQR